MAQSESGSPTEQPPLPAVPFSAVLARELTLIGQRRELVLGQPGGKHDPPDPSPSEAAQRASTFGLAFSGGGIRSATFNLGILQGLAEKGWLKHVDYLSTVSGGGYIGSWLHGVMRRTPAGENPFSYAEDVLGSGIAREPKPPDADPITFLRTYSNYLAPRPGLFSADTWTIGFIWVRNVLLNQLILVPAIAALVSATLLACFLIQWPAPFYQPSLGINVAATVLAAGCLIGAIAVMVRHLRGIAKRSVGPPSAARPGGHQPRPRGTIVVPLVFATLVMLGASGFEVRNLTPAIVIVAFVALMVVIQVAGGFIDCYLARHGTSRKAAAYRDVLWMSIVCGAVAGGLVLAVWAISSPWLPLSRLVLGPPLMGLCFIGAVMLLIGLMGADYPDAAREWTAKVGSLLAMVIVGWLVWFGLVVYGPWAASYTIGHFQTTGGAAVIAWIATTVGGVLAGRSPRTNREGAPGTGRALGLLVTVAPTIFLVGYILAIATAVHAALPLNGLSDPRKPEPPATVTVGSVRDSRLELAVGPDGRGTLERWLQPIAQFSRRYPGTLRLSDSQPGFALPAFSVESWTQLDWVTIILLLTAGTAIVASRRVNINEFSLHHFYKNRLVRCYLGASNTMARWPHPLTGFDPKDDVALSSLYADGDKPYVGPYPIINAALNLNAGSQLATQERKAASFVFTPAYCGFHAGSTPDGAADGGDQLTGGDVFEASAYRPTRGYAYESGPDVGTAMAISGAAANPNWGYHTSGPMAFLLTVFNARLGWWLGNPRWRDASGEPGPKFALRYLFSELLGQTTGSSRFVNLSDGGHFDNLGLYELVRRRCRFIIVCDAEQDAALTFGSLGAAIRKCRADFGVEIDIDPQPIREGTNGFSQAHCVVGTIRYTDEETAWSAGLTTGFDPPDGSKSRGWLLYLKSSLTGDEPADVTEYRSQHPEFPHQSTGDQFFSESQFESYRRLGYHVLRSAFAGVQSAATPRTPPVTAWAGKLIPASAQEAYTLVDLFQGLTRKWYAPIPVSPDAATRLADAYVELMRRVSAQPELQQLHAELLSGTPSPDDRRPAGEVSAAEVAAGIDLLQLVQNVYTEFGFESALNRANPRNSGWMSVFRKWHSSPILSQRIWPKIRNDYHALFQGFVDRLNQPDEPSDRP
jgi:hypothetical protein